LHTQISGSTKTKVFQESENSEQQKYAELFQRLAAIRNELQNLKKEYLSKQEEDMDSSDDESGLYLNNS